MLAIAAIVAGGCGDPVEATLVGLQGCGLEGEVLDTLRIVPRGDFPTSAVDATLVHGGTARLPEIPDDATAITVEGLVGDISIAVGRTPRLDDARGPMPVYFAAQDELCAVQSGIDSREVGGIAVGPGGDVVVVGGRDTKGVPLRDVIHTRDDDELVTPLDEGLRAAATGMAVVPTGPRTFGVFGGARQDAKVLDHWVPIDFSLAQPVLPEQSLDTLNIKVARAYHAAVVLPDGRVLVTGGCEGLLGDGRCDDRPAFQQIMNSSLFIDPSTDPPSVKGGDLLTHPRFDHQMFVARDGSVFVIGGRTYDDGARLGVERWWIDSGGWRSYGKEASQLDLQSNGAISGAALVEGGLFVVAFERGGLGWIDEVSAGSTPAPAILGLDPEQPDECVAPGGGSTYWGGWCDGDPQVDACLFTEDVCPSPTARHRVLALPDERVLVDTWLLPFPHLGTSATHAIDLARMRPGSSTPSRRADAAMLLLADGTVMMAGGRNPDTLEETQPFFLRLRPGLGGPDENIPDLALPGGFVLHDPERVEKLDDRIVLQSSQPDVDTVPAVWAHLRSFRSASFRFEVSLVATDGGVASLVLSQGAIARATIRFGDNVELLQRDVGGHVGLGGIHCSPAGSGPFFDQPLDLRVDVRPDSIVVRNDNAILARCPGIGDTPSAIGFGVAGSILDDNDTPEDPTDDVRIFGTLTASKIRVTRI